MKETQLIFDFDDTIVITNREFEWTNLQNAKEIAKTLYKDESKVDDILTFQRQLDMTLVNKYGLARPRFLKSWLKTYAHFCQEASIAENPAIQAKITEIVTDLYEREFELMPHALETLDKLKKEGYSLVILTAGDEEIQKRRVIESGAIEFVDEVYVRPLKTPETLKEILDWHPARNHVMIGNSLKSDIHPALVNGIWGFHYEQDTWEIDHYDIETSHPKYVHLGSLTEIPSKLVEHVIAKRSA